MQGLHPLGYNLTYSTYKIARSLSFAWLSMYSGLMMVVFPLGVPALFTYLLATHKKRLVRSTSKRASDDALNGLEFLFDHTKPARWYFEIINVLYRLSLTGLLALVEPGTDRQLLVGQVIAGAMAVCTALLAPYVEGRNNAQAVASAGQIFGLFTIARVGLFEAIGEGTIEERRLGVGLILGTLLTLIVSVVCEIGERVKFTLLTNVSFRDYLFIVKADNKISISIEDEIGNMELAIYDEQQKEAETDADC